VTQAETYKFIDVLLKNTEDTRRAFLYAQLSMYNYTDAAFCMALIKHGKSLRLTNEEWFLIMKTIPNKIFEHEHFLLNKLTEKQRNEIFE